MAAAREEEQKKKRFIEDVKLVGVREEDEEDKSRWSKLIGQRHLRRKPAKGEEDGRDSFTTGDWNNVSPNPSFFFLLAAVMSFQSSFLLLTSSRLGI